MSHETKSDDQAMDLQNLINDVQGVETKQNDHNTKQDTEQVKTEQEEDVDILDLPPRKDVHEQGKTRLKFKLNLPLIRFIIIFLVVISLLVIAFSLFGEGTLDSMISKNNLINVISSFNV